MGFLDKVLSDAEKVGKTGLQMSPLGPTINLGQSLLNPMQTLTHPQHLIPNYDLFRTMGRGIGPAAHVAGVVGHALITNPNAVDRSVPNAAQQSTQHPTDRGSVGASPTGQPGPARSDAHSTAWDTDPMYAVVSRLTNKDYNTMFKGMKDATSVTNKATSVVLQKLAEAGYKIDADAAKAFTDGAEATMTAWYQANTKANGHPPSMTEYFEALTRAALLSRGQTPSETASTTTSTADTTSNASGLDTTTTAGTDATTWGTHAPEKIKDNTVSTLDPTSEDAQNKFVALFGNDQHAYNAYVGWVGRMNTLSTQRNISYDESPEAFDRYYGYSDQKKMGG